LINEAGRTSDAGRCDLGINIFHVLPLLMLLSNQKNYLIIEHLHPSFFVAGTIPILIGTTFGVTDLKKKRKISYFNNLTVQNSAN